MRKMITLPGIGGSNAKHWQTYWEKEDQNFLRFEPKSWNQPDLQNWIQSLDRTVLSCAEPPVLVAHSLACLLVAHWAQQYDAAIAGAFLVSVPDPSSEVFPKQAYQFVDFPDKAFAFPAFIVASSSDPYASISYASQRSKKWQCGFKNVGALGHINDLGYWKDGRDLLEKFVADL